jgi:hypothetical protein
LRANHAAIDMQQPVPRAIVLLAFEPQQENLRELETAA